MGGEGSHVITLDRRCSSFVLRVDCARWGQTPEDLRHLALSAPHARTRERALALFDITQHSCATQVALRTGRRAHTVMGLPTGGRAPMFGGEPLRSGVKDAFRSIEPSTVLAPSRTRRAGWRRCRCAASWT